MSPIPNLSAYLALGVVIIGGLWAIDHGRQVIAYQTLELRNTNAENKALSDALMAQIDLHKLADEQARKLHDLGVTNARIENERDAAIAAGAKRVYVRANCPAMSETSGTTAGANAVAAELDPAYRSTLSELRRRDREKDAVIIGLQDYVRACRGEK